MTIIAAIANLDRIEVTGGGIWVDGFSGADAGEQIQAALDYANGMGSPQSLVFTQEKYTLANSETFDFTGHAIAGMGGGQRGINLNFSNPTAGQTLVTVGGDRANVSNLWVSCGISGSSAPALEAKWKDITGIRFTGLTNASVKHVEVRQYATDTIGIVVDDDCENCLFETVALGAAMPVHYYGGTDMTFENLDLSVRDDPETPGTPGVTGGNIAAAIQGNPDGTTALNHVSFSGSVQGGNYAVYFDSPNIATKGSMLQLKMLRSEQGDDLPSSGFYVHQHMIGTSDDGLEVLMFDGIRSGLAFTNGYDVLGVSLFERRGCFLSGAGAGGSQVPLSLDGIQALIDALP